MSIVIGKVLISYKSLTMEMEGEHMVVETSEFPKKLKNKLMESTVLDSFTKLTSDREPIRITAGVSLLRHLKTANDDKRESEYTYVLERLVRGVGSSRKNAKTGFYSALVALLSKSDDISTASVLDSIKKHLILSGSNCKSENADISMGQILACGALIHANRFVNSSIDEQKLILEILFTAGKKRSFLNLAAFTFVSELLDVLNDEQFKILWEIIKPEVAKPWKEQNLDTLYLLCLVRDKFPAIVKTKFIKKILEVPEIIHEDSIKELTELLMITTCLATLKHPIYVYIAQKVAQSDCVPKWCTEIDSQLEKPNRNKFLIAISTFTTIVSNLRDSSELPHILTHQFTLTTLHYFKTKTVRNPDVEFLTSIDKLFLAITQSIESASVTSKTKLAVLKKLLFYPGTFIFEKITRTKIIQTITASLDADGVKKLAKLYREIVLGAKPKVISETETESWINLDRIYAANLLIKLFRNQSVLKEHEWRLEQVKFLFKLGFVKEGEETNVGAELAASFKDCFYHSLDQKFPTLEDLRSLLSSLIHFINDTIFTNKTLELRSDLPENAAEIWGEMMKLIKTLENKQKSNYIIPVFHTLLLHMGLQLFKHFDMAQNALKELHLCYNKIQTEKCNNKKNENNLETNASLDNETEPEWIEVVVDLFLSLLSYNSHLLRNVVSCVFPFLCPHLTMQSLRQIFDVLDPKNEDNPLIKSRHESSDEDVTSDDDDDDLEEVDEESESESDDSGLEVNEEAEEDSAMDKLRMAVQSALHKQGYKSDDESEDIDTMDNEVGKKLDKALAAAFKLSKKSPKGKQLKQSRDDKILTHFRVRVLDLIEQYIDSEPSLQQTLELITLLLQTLEFSIRDIHQKPLEIRLRKCLKKLSTPKKFTLDVTEASLAKILNTFLEKGSKSAFIYQDMDEVISDCCLFVVKCSQMIETDINKSNKPSELERNFQNFLELFFKNRDCLLPLVMFKKVIQSSWTGNWSLVPQLVDLAFDSEIRPFRKNQAIELLRLFYNNSRYRCQNMEQFKLKITPIETQLSEKCINSMKSLTDNMTQSNIREKSFCSLLNLLLVVKKANGSEQIDWDAIGELIKVYRSHVALAKDTKIAYGKLCRVIGIDSAVTMVNTPMNGQTSIDNDSELEEDDDDEQKGKKRKKAIKNDKQKLKKEASLLRVKASSKGFENEMVFGAVSLAEIKAQDGSETEVADELKKKLKKKKKKMRKTVKDDSSDEEMENGEVDLKSTGNKANSLENGTNKNKKRYNSESDERPKKLKKNK